MFDTWKACGDAINKVGMSAILTCTRVEVLIEGESKKSSEDFFGKTRSFKTTVFPRRNTSVGETVEVKIHTATAQTLIGDIIAVNQ